MGVASESISLGQPLEDDDSRTDASNDVLEEAEYDGLDNLVWKRRRLHAQYDQMQGRRDWAIAVGGPIFLFLLVTEVIYLANLYYRQEGRGEFLRNLFSGGLWSDGNVKATEIVTTSAFLTHSIVWVFLTLAVVGFIYHFGVQRRVQSVEREVAEVDNEFRRNKIRSEKGWRQVLTDELHQFMFVTATIFQDDEVRAKQAKAWTADANKILAGEKKGSLIDVEFRINSIKNLVSLEEREQADQLRWRNFTIAIMGIYIGLAIYLSFLPDARHLLDDKSDVLVNIFGVPLRILFWAGMGSLAAILYRFYTTNGLVRFDVELRWLIARPLIGIIMGAMAYLALEAGLLLMSGEQPAVKPEVALIGAFIAGFSDKFYLGVIDLLVRNVGGNHLEEDETLHNDQ